MDQWEGGHRISLIVMWTGKIAPSSKSNETVCLTDAMATCAAIEQLRPFALIDTAPEAPGQLYNLQTDPSEKNNLYYQYLEIVLRIKALLENSKASSRSIGTSRGR